MIHIAGGRIIERNRLLDDHLHAVPAEVYDLLACVDAPDATVILERDGLYPAIDDLLRELDRARAVIPSSSHGSYVAERTHDEHRDILPLLATLYTDDHALSAFSASNELGVHIEDLHLAARSFARKRAHK